MSYFTEELIETEDVPSSRLIWQGADEDQLVFMRKVYDINHRWSSANGTFIADIPGDELETIEGNHKARTPAAAACRDLLAVARQAIQTAGVNVVTGLTSAYRSATRQLSLWQSYFPNYYNETKSHRESLSGGPHGEKAVSYLAGYIRPKVAIPGYSNHQNGIAVDLLNIENGEKISNKTKPPFPAKWRETWLWGWLETNANSFGFYQNTNINEPWHWEYKGRTAASHESYLEEFDEMEDHASIPVLLNREVTPAAETLYVKIDLGLRNERIFRKDNPRNDKASVEQMTGIFIPKNLAASSEIDLLIYLHGHKSDALGKDKSINDYWNAKKFPHFAFREMVNNSGKNMILAAPTLGPRSQPGTLITDAGFTSFISQVIDSIIEYCQLYKNHAAPTIKNIIVACHSGGGYAMYKIAELAEKNDLAKKIKECWGFDCTYGPDDSDSLYKWASANTEESPRNLYIYYRRDTGTEAQSTSLKDRSKQLASVSVTGLPKSADHNSIPGIYIKDRLAGLNEESESFYEEECGCENEEYENDYAGEDIVIFPSGEQLDITTGAETKGEEYYDPNNSGNPLLDTSGANKGRLLSANFKVGEIAKSGGTDFDKARIDPELILCLQAIRDHVSKAVKIRSGYRSYAHNLRISKSSTNVAKLSQHMSGRAADISIEGMTGFEIAKVALDVYGCNIGTGLAPNFAHIDVRGKFAAWRYAGDPGEMDDLVEKIRDYQKKCLKKISADAGATTESDYPTTVESAAFDLFLRSYISYEIFQAIIDGERNQDKLTDMVFQYRHPERIRLSAVLQSSQLNYKYLRTEWNEIRSKIIMPIFRNENAVAIYSEISTGKINSNEPFQTRRPNAEVVEKKGYDDPFGRAKWFNESRFGRNQVPSDRQLVAFADASKMMGRSKLEAFEQYDIESLFDFEGAPSSMQNNWVPLGPSVVKHGQASANPEVSGRVTSIAVGPSGKRVYIGTANGGVWYSPDEGASWEPLDQWSNTRLASATPGVDADSLSIGAIAVAFNKDKREKDIIYAGTGEPLAEFSAGFPGGAISALYYFGVGIKISNDGGLSWKLEGTKNLKGVAIYKIVIDPADITKVYAATSKGLFQRPKSNFDSWDPITIPGATGAITDFLITRSGVTVTYYASEILVGVYSGNDVKTLSLISSPAFATNNFIFKGRNYISPTKIALAASESNSNIIYALYEFDALVAGNIVTDSYLYRLDASAGNVFQRISGVPNVLNGKQGAYSIILAVDPLNENMVYIGGDYTYDGPPPPPPPPKIDPNPELYTLSLFKGSINTATLAFSFTNAADPRADTTYRGQGIHADAHAIAFALDASANKQDPNKVWIACDGGVFYSDIAGRKNSFVPKNKGLAITQLTYFSQSPLISSLIFSGCQDNATIRCIGNSEWERGEGYGDGGGVSIDPDKGVNIIAQIHHGNYVKNTWANSKWQDINPDLRIPGSVPVLRIDQNESDSARFYSPIDSFFDPVVKKTIVALGTTRLWFSDNWGTSWQSLPSNTNNYLPSPPSGSDYLNVPISSIKIASLIRIFATTESDVFQYDLSGANWTLTPIPRIGLTPGQYFITCIDVEPTNINNFYVSLGGPGSFNRCYYCYLDTHSVYHWIALGPSKLNIPCHAVLVDPLNPLEVYLGSDVGVWKRSKNPDNPKQLIWSAFSYGLPESPVADLKIHNLTRMLRVATHGRGMYEIPLDFAGAKSGTRKTKKIDLYLRGNKLDNRREDSKGVYQWSLISLDPDNSWSATFLDSPDIWIEERRSFKFFMVQVNNRGFQQASMSDVLVTLMIADASGSPPLLPIDVLNQIQAKDIKTDWSKTPWKLVGRRNPKANINSLVPQVVEFGGDLSVLLPGSKEAWIVAMVSTLSNEDPFKASEPDVRKLMLINKQIACKKVKVI